MLARTAFMVLLAAGLPAMPLLAQTDSTKQPDDAERKADLESFLVDAKSYEIVMERSPAASLDLVQQPVMNWVGSAFVWTDRGRPEVIGTFWNTRSNRTGQLVRQHAFHSLSERPITAKFEEKLVWNPKSAGLQFRPLDGAEAPSDKAWRRLAQMRELSRDFTVSGFYPRYESPRRTLRLLTQPIFRYASPPRVEDGAIFVYSADVQAIDPDALLILEARPKDGKLRWEYAFARFHYIELTGYHREKEVWKVEDESLLTRQHQFGGGSYRDSIYYSVTRP